MTTLHTQAPSTNGGVAPTTAQSRPQLDGATLSPATLALIATGTAGGILFAIIYLIEGATRPGYIAWQQAISALSLGPGGWVQQANFLMLGIATLCSMVGWRRALAPGAASTWYPIFKFAEAFGLIVDAFFSQDPAPGYPVGAALVAPTLHAEIHTIFAIVCITAIALGDFTLARRFAVDRRWRGWALFTVLTGVLTIVFIALFGASGASGGIAGIYERISTNVNSILSVAILVRLLLDRRR